NEFGEVPGHGPLVTAADLHLVAVTEDDGPETVPLRLVAVLAVGYLLDRFGEHRRDRRADPKAPWPILPLPWRTCSHPTGPARIRGYGLAPRCTDVGRAVRFRDQSHVCPGCPRTAAPA